MCFPDRDGIVFYGRRGDDAVTVSIGQEPGQVYYRGGCIHCLKIANYELIVRTALHCVVLRQPLRSRQILPSIKAPGDLAPICRRIFAVAFTRDSGNRAFAAAPFTIALGPGKRSPSSLLADRTGDRTRVQQSRCLQSSRLCEICMNCCGI